MTLVALSKLYGRNLTVTSRTFTALVALSKFQKWMLLSILYLSDIISNVYYNVLSYAQLHDKILFPLDCRLCGKNVFCVSSVYLSVYVWYWYMQSGDTEQTKIVRWKYYTSLHSIYTWRKVTRVENFTRILMKEES